MTPVPPGGAVSPVIDARPGRATFGLAALAVTAGLVYLGVAPQHWLRGVLVVAGGLLFAGLSRWALPDRLAGPLLVRGRWFDGACYVAVAVAVAGFGVAVR